MLSRIDFNPIILAADLSMNGSLSILAAGLAIDGSLPRLAAAGLENITAESS
jgi:hypothetical protein